MSGVFFFFGDVFVEMQLVVKGMGLVVEFVFCRVGFIC